MHQNQSRTFLMLPGYFLNDPRIILWSLIFHDFHHFWKVCPCFGWSRSRGEKCWMPSERALKTMGIHVENDSFDELDQEISLVKGGPGTQSGGTPPGQSGGHRQPGGECFAPFVWNGWHVPTSCASIPLRPYGGLICEVLVSSSKLPT